MLVTGAEASREGDGAAEGKIVLEWIVDRTSDIGGLWLPTGAALLLLFALAAGEIAWPVYRDPKEGRGRLTTNFGLGILNALLAWMVPLTAIVAAGWAEERGVGLLHAMEAPVAVALVATVAARSLLAYGLHRLSHRLPLLWRFHAVHHADTAMDLSTGFRHHPMEALYLAAAAAGLAVALGLSPDVLAGYELAAAAMSAWLHANLRMPETADRVAGALLITPALHHVHHSARQAETDSNYGDVFTVWDRLFGSYRRLGDAERLSLRFGLGDAVDPVAADFTAQLAGPFRPPPAPRHVPETP